MTYNDIVILIPCHSLDDFPTELDEKDAESLLNAFAVAWHPELLASTRVIPSWHRSDEPPQFLTDRLMLVPKTSEDWLPYGWIEEAESNGATVVSGKIQRDEYTEAVLAPLHSSSESGEAGSEQKSAAELSPDLVADFYALGFCYIQLELLTRCMHHFSSLDEATIQREAIAAADAALAADAEAARAHLKACFEVLLENRERFYPIDCYLIDLCLVVPEWANENLKTAIQDEQPLNLLMTAKDLETIAHKDPELISLLKKSSGDQETEVIGGDLEEIATPVIAVESLIWQMQAGTSAIRELSGRAPTTWARRRFGLASVLPMLLHRLGFHSALHLVLDDGIYPDYEQSKIHWEGADGTILDAYSRIPMSAEGAAGYLRFPQRMAESMEEDQVGALMFARWPEVKSVFYEDMKRIHRYAPVLGSFVLLNDFFQNTESSGRHSSYDAREYLSPFLSQLVAMRKPDPLSRFVKYFRRYDEFTAGRWFQTVSQAIFGKQIEETSLLETEEQIELAHPDAEEEAIKNAENALAGFHAAGVSQLANIILQGADQEQAGMLLLNSLSFNRRVVVDLPDFPFEPEAREYIKATQFDERHKKAVVEIPGAGFVWLQPGKAPAPAVKTTSWGTEITAAQVENIVVAMINNTDLTGVQAVGKVATILGITLDNGFQAMTIAAAARKRARTKPAELPQMFHINIQDRFQGQIGSIVATGLESAKRAVKRSLGQWMEPTDRLDWENLGPADSVDYLIGIIGMDGESSDIFATLKPMSREQEAEHQERIDQEIKNRVWGW